MFFSDGINPVKIANFISGDQNQGCSLKTIGIKVKNCDAVTFSLNKYDL